MAAEMDYEDANGETLTSSRRITLYPSAVRLGLKTDGWLMRDNDLRLNFIALNLDGKPISAASALQVALYNREIITARRRLIGGFYAYDNQMRTTRLDAHLLGDDRQARPRELRDGAGHLGRSHRRRDHAPTPTAMKRAPCDRCGSRATTTGGSAATMATGWT